MFRGKDRIDIGAPKLRVLLAALLVRANHPVSLDELAMRLWGEEPPRTARRTTQAHAMRLRRILGDDESGCPLLHTQPDGYSIEVAPEQLDLLRFRQLRAEARNLSAGGAAEELVVLERALELWRGRSLSDIPSEALQRDVVPQLEEDKLLVVEHKLEIELRLGRFRDVISELVQLTKEHPWHERFWEQLIIALYRAERIADALDTYRTVQRRFRVELGVEPGERLQSLHQEILTGAGNGDSGSVEKGPVDERSDVVPVLPVGLNQLPPVSLGFVARSETDALTALAERAQDSMPVMTLVGMPGVGKTTLAVHVAHRLRERFPDGQLFLDLKGFADRPPLTAAEAVAAVLGSLGVPAARLADDIEGRTAAYRAVLAGRRVLVVLDDAADADQVRALLPGTPGSAVLVTSRMDLPVLAVTNGAERVVLDALRPDQSAELLVNALGEDRARREPTAVAALAELCANHPLALRVAGARIAADPHSSIAEHVRDLRLRGRLAQLSVDGAERVGVRAAIALSYRRLAAADQSLLRAISNSPDRDVTVRLVTSWSGVAQAEVRRALDRLVAASLLRREPADEYRVHALVREYARDLEVDDRVLSWHRPA